MGFAVVDIVVVVEAEEEEAEVEEDNLAVVDVDVDDVAGHCENYYFRVHTGKLGLPSSRRLLLRFGL